MSLNVKRTILLYINREDIRKASAGSRSCVLAQALNRRFPREGAHWGVGLRGANLWGDGVFPLSDTSLVRVKLGSAAMNVVNMFDSELPVEPQHVRIYVDQGTL